MKKKILGKKVLMSLLAGGMIYTGGVALPDIAVDKAAQMLPGVVNVTYAATSVIDFDIPGTGTPQGGTSPDDDISITTPLGDNIILLGAGHITADMNVNNKTLTIRNSGLTGSTVKLSYNLNGNGVVALENGEMTFATQGVTINPKFIMGVDTTSAEATTVTGSASQFANGVVMYGNATLELNAGSFKGTLEVGSADSKQYTDWTSDVNITGNVSFADGVNGSIVFSKSGTNNNHKRLFVDSTGQLTIGAGNILFDGGKGSNNFFELHGGIINFLEGTLDEDITIEGRGIVNIQGDVTMKADQVQSTSIGDNRVGIVIADGKRLILTGGSLGVDIGNTAEGKTGTVVINNGTEITSKLSPVNAIPFKDKTEIYAKVENAGKMTDMHTDFYNDIKNSSSGTIQIAKGNIHANIDNSGLLQIDDTESKIEQSNISNSGKITTKGVIATTGTVTNGVAGEIIVGTEGDATNSSASKIINEGQITIHTNFQGNIDNKATGKLTIDGVISTTTNTIENAGVLTAGTKVEVKNILNSGTMNAMGYQGVITTADNSFVNSGELNTLANNISTDITNTGVVNLWGDKTGADGEPTADGTLTKNISGAGTLNINGKVEVDAGKIDQQTLNIASGGTLTVTTINATDASKIKVGDDYITNEGKFVIKENSTLTKDIKGAGITELTGSKTLYVVEDHEIEGTLDANGAKIDMREAALNSGEYPSDAIQTFTIGKLKNTVNLSIDVDMSTFTADTLDIGSAQDATINLENINVVKDFVCDPNVIEVPLVKEEENKITYVTGAGASAVTYSVGSGSITPTYTTAKTTTQVVTNNYLYTFSSGSDKGKLDYKVEKFEITLQDFIEGTLPGYDGTEDPVMAIDPHTMSLTDDMEVPATSTMGTARIGAATQTYSKMDTHGDPEALTDGMTINLNGHNLTNAGTQLTIYLDDTTGRILNINGGSGGTVSNTIDFNISANNTLKFDGETEINGKITNAADGNVVNAAMGTLVLKGAITNNGTITNEASGDNLGRMTITSGGVTAGTGKIVNNGQLLVDANIANDIHNVTTGDTVSRLLVKEGKAVSGNLYNGIPENSDVYGFVDIQNADDLSGGKQVFNCGVINIEKGTLVRDVTNDGSIFIGTKDDAVITGNITQSESIDEDETPTIFICGDVTFNGDSKEISNFVNVVKSSQSDDIIWLPGLVPYYDDSSFSVDGFIPKDPLEYTGNFTISNGTVTGDVWVDDGAELHNDSAGLIKGFVTNEGTMTTKASGVVGHTGEGEDKLGVKNTNSLTLLDGDLGTGITDDTVLSGTTTVKGTVTNDNDYTITQKSLVIDSSGSLKTDVDVIHIGENDTGLSGGTQTFINDGTLTFTADGTGNGQYGDDTDTVDTLQEAVEGNGTLNFGVSGGTNIFHALGEITQSQVNVHEDLNMDNKLQIAGVGNITVDATKTLTIAAGNLLGDVTNNGIVELEGHFEIEEEGNANILATGNTITGGKIRVLEDIQADVSDLKSDAGIWNKESTLTLTGSESLHDNIYGEEVSDVTQSQSFGTTYISAGATISNDEGKKIMNNLIVEGEFDNGTDGVITGSDKLKTQVVVLQDAKLTSCVDNIKICDEVFNFGDLVLKDGTHEPSGLGYSITNLSTDPSVTGTTTLEGVVNNASDKDIVQQKLIITVGGGLISNADRIVISSGTISNAGKLSLTGGVLNSNVLGSGTTSIVKKGTTPADVTVNGILKQKVEIEEDNTLRIAAGNLQDKGTTVENKGNLILGSGNLEKQVNCLSSGNIEYAGDVVVKGVPVPSNVNVMKVDNGRSVDFTQATTKQMTVNKLDLGSDTVVKLQVSTAGQDTLTSADSTNATINGVTEIQYGENNILYIDGTVADAKYYPIVGGTGITGDEKPWDLIILTENGVEDFGHEMIYVTDEQALGHAVESVVGLYARPKPTIVSDIDCDAPTVFDQMKKVLPVFGEERTFLRSADQIYAKEGKQKGLDAWNSVASMTEIAGVSKNLTTAALLTMNVVEEHMGAVHGVEAGGRYDNGRAYILDTVSQNFANMVPNVVPSGDAESLMPQRVRGNGRSIMRAQSGNRTVRGGRSLSNAINQDNQVWASYIHTKEEIDGLKTGNATNDSDISYNGASVGIDLWNGDTSVGGIFGSYVKGKVDATNSAAVTRNDIDNYGVGFYNRKDYSFGSLLFDASYTHSKNDIKQDNIGYELTAKPKADAYTAGIRIEKFCHVGGSMFTPFVGARYLGIRTKSYENNYGMRYKVKDQDMLTVPVGLKWCGDFAMGGARIKPSIEGGYNFNVGGRNNKQKVSFDGVTDTVRFDAMDKGNYFVRVGTDIVSRSSMIGLYYKHTSGDHVKDNQFNVNLAFDF